MNVPAKKSERPINWKSNLTFVWLSQFFSLMGFGFALPFAAFYIHEDLGVADSVAVKYWTAIFAASSAVTLAIMAPIWGRAADLYGRRLMMLRANFGGCVVLFLMGCAPSVEWLIFFRLLQGMFTGTVTAAVTLVAVSTPERRQGLAIGSLAAAVQCGQIAGNSLGGFCSRHFSYANCFKLSSLLLLTSGLLVLFLVKENFVKPEGQDKPVKPETEPKLDLWIRIKARVRKLLTLPRIGPGWPVLVLICAVGLAYFFDRSLLPLFVQELENCDSRTASYWSGQLMAVGGFASMFSGILMGWLSDRFRPQIMARMAALGAGAFMAGQGVVSALWQLFAVRAAHLIFVGGLDPVFQIWLVRVTPEEKRGSVLGWAVTARSLGWIAAPLLSAVVANLWGLRAMFFAASISFFIIIPLIGWSSRRMLENNSENLEQ